MNGRRRWGFRPSAKFLSVAFHSDYDRYGKVIAASKLRVE
jgi:hypothetical protein